MIGRTISHYQILECLGEGGMGVVYKARHLRLPRTVALKFLPRESAENSDRLTRLRSEARAISQLSHSHIATLYEFEETDGQCFLVLEYLSGGTLRDKIREKQREGVYLPMRQVLDYARQIAEGLAYAHRHKIIHRDVKSDNVMLDEEGILKLTDFGLAKLEGDAGITRSGVTPGTVAYMAPELLHGKPADNRTDIFSFGVVLYEMITGQLPFGGTEIPALMHSILYEEPVPVSEHRPNVPAGLGLIVDRALEKNPDKRHQRMEELLAELEALAKKLQLLGDEAPTTTTVKRKKGLLSSHFSATRQFIARRPLWQKLAGTVVISLVLLLASSLPFGNWFSNLIRNVSVQKPFVMTVQPFKNVTGIREDEQLLEGLAFSLNSKLVSMSPFSEDLTVLHSRELRKGLSFTDLHRQYGIDYVITGSLQHYGDARRITLELVDARTAKIVHSRTYERVAPEAFEMQDLIFRDLCGFLQLEFKAEMVASVTHGSPPKSGAYELYLRAIGIQQMAKQPGDIDVAIQLLQKAVGIDSQYAMAYMELSYAYLAKYERPEGKNPQSINEAQTYAEKALLLAPKLAETHIAMAWVYRSQGKKELALMDIDEALKYSPEDSRIFRLRARTYQDLVEDEKAGRDFRHAIELKPKSALNRIDYGAFLTRKKRYSEAEDEFRKVLEIAPDHYMANENLCGILLYQGKYREAIEFGERALKIFPSKKTYNNVATGYYFLKQYDQAAENFLAATINSNDHRMWRGLGDAYLKIPGKEAAAKEAFLKAADLAEEELKVNPKNASAHCQLAVYLAKGGDFAKARQEAEIGLKLDPNDAPNQIQAALAHALAGDRRKALQLLQAAIGTSKDLLRTVTNNAEFENLVKDPRFRQIMGQEVVRIGN